MNFADYIAPAFDFGLGPDWEVIFAKKGILDQFWTIGLKYYAPDGEIYGTYTYIDEAISIMMYPAQVHLVVTSSVKKMQATILAKPEEYKLQDGMGPLPFGAIPNPFGPGKLGCLASPVIPRRDVDKYDYLLEEGK